MCIFYICMALQTIQKVKGDIPWKEDTKEFKNKFSVFFWIPPTEA